jgi:hypothetical protein
MKTIKMITTILATMLFILSCSKNEGSQETSLYRVKEVRDANNNLINTIEYDNKNRLLKIKHPIGVVEYTYNNAGLLSKLEYSGFPAGNGNNSINYYTYNNKGLIIKEEFSGYPVGNNGNYIMYNTYDTNGDKTEELVERGDGLMYKKLFFTTGVNIVSIENYEFSSNTNTWKKHNTYTNTYDNNKRLIESRYPFFNLTPNISSKGYLDKYRYDSNGNMTYREHSVQETSTSSFVLKSSFEITYDNIKPPYYPNTVLDNYGQIKTVSSEYNNAGGLISAVVSNNSYEYNPEGFVTKVFFNGKLEGVSILEKIE